MAVSVGDSRYVAEKGRERRCSESGSPCRLARIPGMAVLVLAAFASPSFGEESFNQRIRPILSENCYKCHGHDKNSRQAGLRLDLQESAVADRDGKRAIVPGKALESELVRRITSRDPDVQMPPPESGKTLTDREVAALIQWIDDGAAYEPHWAYIPPVKHTLPEATSWVENAIDHYTLLGMAGQGLLPSREADRRTLIRRLSMDLTGLPPTPDAVEQFVGDANEGAYERLVDRLLASPHYGERMALDWLDQVRYADTNGFHADEFRSVWPYRDYVIRAFNENKPYDRFTVEQVAGDLLPRPDRNALVAATYNRLNQITAEVGAQEKEYRAMYAADRVRTMASVWLGSTLGCAQCHDHKYDPYTMKDFYSFAAFFADIEEQGVFTGGGPWEPMLKLTDEADEQQLRAFDERIASLQAILDTPTEALAASQRDWETEILRDPPLGFGVWKLAGPYPEDDFVSVFNRPFAPEEEGASVAWEERPDWRDGEIHDLHGGLAASYAVREIISADERPLEISLGSNDGLKVWHNGKLVLAVKELRGARPDQDLVTLNLEPGVNTLLFKIVNGGARHQFYYRSIADGMPWGILRLIRMPESERSAGDRAALASYFRTVAPELARVQEELAAVREQRAKYFEDIPEILLTRSTTPREVRILPRGNFLDETGPVVEPDTPEFLVPMAAGGRRPTRLDLAEWLVSRENPLTARVYVNRLWKQFFGTGLSRVLDDLGFHGEWPTHPELLDWLAVEFMDSGWDIKHTVKLMVMSATYRQASGASPEAREADPLNRWLARQSRYRYPAELVRDNALAVSGLLARDIGGPSVYPYQPDGYYDNCNTPERTVPYPTSDGADQYRRGLYTFWKRSFLHPSMMAFDAPSREECTAERTRSNTPLQALVLLNDPSYVEAARSLATRMIREGGATAEERIAFAYEQALSRAPRPDERQVLEHLCGEHLRRYSADRDAAEALIGAGSIPVPEDLDPSELAAYTSVARVILNLHEFVTRS